MNQNEYGPNRIQKWLIFNKSILNDLIEPALINWSVCYLQPISKHPTVFNDWFNREPNQQSKYSGNQTEIKQLNNNSEF